MLLIVAASDDAGARSAAARWSAHDARVLRPSDLSTSGWSHLVHDPTSGTFVVGGEKQPATAIAGVVTRLSAVRSSDLPDVLERDRDYVAAEMTAFLVAWLTALRCPVVNRPSPIDLTGPGWPAARWAAQARAVGFEVSSAFAELRRVTVVGDRLVEGDQDDGRTRAATALAARANVDLLHLLFAPNGAFCAASTRPDLDCGLVADAVVSHVLALQRRQRRH